MDRSLRSLKMLATYNPDTTQNLIRFVLRNFNIPLNKDSLQRKLHTCTRKTREATEDKWSGSITTPTGEPQGSILGPVLLTVHLIPWFHFLDGLNNYYHFHADDSQLIFAFDNN